ncbi:fungal specific transcription protein [Rutstroemia sp. NJR-2017a WRK4]|nr:fungal specific transcription protein [Rutstroemia sp. NJR-2017a WRK4]
MTPRISLFSFSTRIFPLLRSLPSSYPIFHPYPTSSSIPIYPPHHKSISNMSQHTYSSAYPQALKPEAGIKEFFEKFYEISDTRDRHEDYAGCFTGDATLFMGVKESRGFEEILAFRKGMWEKVEKRLHTIKKVFPFGDGAKEVMLYGTVEYLLKDGRKATVSTAPYSYLLYILRRRSHKVTG